MRACLCTRQHYARSGHSDRQGPVVDSDLVEPHFDLCSESIEVARMSMNSVITTRK